MLLCSQFLQAQSHHSHTLLLSLSNRSFTTDAANILIIAFYVWTWFRITIRHTRSYWISDRSCNIRVSMAIPCNQIFVQFLGSCFHYIHYILFIFIQFSLIRGFNILFFNLKQRFAVPASSKKIFKDLTLFNFFPNLITLLISLRSWAIRTSLFSELFSGTMMTLFCLLLLSWISFKMTNGFQCFDWVIVFMY